MAKQFEIQATITTNTTVTVDAETAEEAIERFEAGDWADDGFGEKVNIQRRSMPKQSYP